MDRRPLKVRSASWAKNFAAMLAKAGIKPNFISVMSVVFAAIVLITGAMAKNQSLYLLLSAALIQMRLICNLLDGMVAVEHNQSSANGELFNDVPDRFADVFIILGASFSIANGDSYSLSALNLAGIGSMLAIITAYVRVLGKSLGTESYFFGPMAKQHRMFFMTVAFITEFFLHGSSLSGKVMYGALVLIALGSFLTVFRRLIRISNDLMSK